MLLLRCNGVAYLFARGRRPLELAPLSLTRAIGTVSGHNHARMGELLHWGDTSERGIVSVVSSPKRARMGELTSSPCCLCTSSPKTFSSGTLDDTLAR